jgi:hypothetical protein
MVKKTNKMLEEEFIIIIKFHVRLSRFEFNKLIKIVKN